MKEYHDKHGHQLPVLRDLKGSFYVRDERDGILSLGEVFFWGYETDL